jgi:phosphatidylserine/phosphatidylglycerophosphate/cardiolipin synthase-like enzyme
VGDQFSFIYYRGTRAGQRRMVRLVEKKGDDPETREEYGSDGIQLVCEEMLANGDEVTRKYWPAHTGGASYIDDYDEGVEVNASQGSGRDAAATLPQSTVLARGKAVMAITSGEAATEAGQLQTWKGLVGLEPKPREPRPPHYNTATDQLAAQQRIAAMGRVSVEFYTGPRMLPVIKQEFDDIKHSFVGMQYQMDHTECCVKIVLKLGQGVEGRIIFDRTSFLSSSCVRQCARMSELYQAGCQMKLLKPSSGGGFACMHAKTWVFDSKVLLTGSTNLTHNGMQNNKEHMFRITEPTGVSQVLADFEEEWKNAEEVKQSHLDDMKANWDKKDTDKRRTRSASVSVSRSLSTELDSATSSHAQI